MGQGISEFKGPLTNAKGAFSESLGEFVAFGMLWHAKRGAQWVAQKEKNLWQPNTVGMLSEKTLGIVGYGSIGEEVAKCVKNGFNTRILACKRDPTKLSPSARACIDDCYSFGELDRILEESDFIVSAVPLTPQTKEMWNMEKFKKMKKSGVFMNIGRGPSVNEHD